MNQLAGYLLGTLDFALEGEVNPSGNRVLSMCDASHRGDHMSSRSQTGVVLCLNGVHVMWRSNRQPVTSLSPAESEIYALSVGVRDARLLGWVLEEFGVEVRWPLKIWCDSEGAISFKDDTCPVSKSKGAFDYRMNWVEELKEEGKVAKKKVKEARNLADMMTMAKAYPTYKFKLRMNLIREAKKIVEAD